MTRSAVPYPYRRRARAPRPRAGRACARRDRAPLRRAGGSRCPRAPHHRAVRAGPADGHVRRLALSREPRRAPSREPAATLTASPEQRFEELRRTLDAAMASADNVTDAMRALRLFKTDVALLTALCDLAGVWPVMEVTHRLSEAADAAVSTAVGFLFRQAAPSGRVAGRRSPTATSCSAWASTAPSSSTTPPTSTSSSSTISRACACAPAPRCSASSCA